LGKGAEKQAIDVRQNGSTARGDAVLGEELVEIVEGVVDALSGLEVVVIRGELEVVVGGLDLQLFGAMPGAESGARVGNGQAALAARWRAIGAAD
jgi:hypothetical protein